MSPHTFTLAVNVVLVPYVTPVHDKIVVVDVDVDVVEVDVVVDVDVVVEVDVVEVDVVVDVDVVVEVEVVVDVVVDVEVDTLVGSVGIIVVVELFVIETVLNRAVRVLLPVNFIVIFCDEVEDNVILVGDGVPTHSPNEYPEGAKAYAL
jgi:hypothetical protein